MTKSELMLESVSNMVEVLKEELENLQAEKQEITDHHRKQVELNEKLLSQFNQKETGTRLMFEERIKQEIEKNSALQNEVQIKELRIKELEEDNQDLFDSNHDLLDRLSKKSKNEKTEEFFKKHKVDLKMPALTPSFRNDLLFFFEKIGEKLTKDQYLYLEPMINYLKSEMTEAKPAGVEKDFLDAINSGYVVVARSGDAKDNETFGPLAFETPITRMNLADVIRFGKRIEPRYGKAVVCKLVPVQAVVEEKEEIQVMEGEE